MSQIKSQVFNFQVHVESPVIFFFLLSQVASHNDSTSLVVLRLGQAGVSPALTQCYGDGLAMHDYNQITFCLLCDLANACMQTNNIRW